MIGLGVVATQAQSGWAQSKGSSYSQLAWSYYASSDFYGTDGTLFSGSNTFSNHSLQLYGEYGWTDQLTVLADLPFLRVNRFSNTERVAGVGDIRLGLKYQFAKQLPLAVSIMADIPTNDGVNFATAKSANELGIFERINLPTSDGEFNLWTTVAYSQSFAKGKGYGSIYGQLNLRTKEFSNQIKLGGELGYRLFPKLLAIARLSMQERWSDELAGGANFLYGEGTTFTSVGLSLMYDCGEHLRLVASFADYNSWLADLRNIYDGSTYMIGVAVEL